VKFNKKTFQKEFLGDDPDHPSRPKFWKLFIKNNPNAKYNPMQDDEEAEEEIELKDIEIGEFLEFF
jgi:hypothetical protein